MVKEKECVVDAQGRVLGRLATEIAGYLMGKDSVLYLPNRVENIKVKVINASKIVVTGEKLEDKNYFRHTGYPSGVRTKSLSELIKIRPEEVIQRAVFGMLPKNKLRSRRMGNLKVYSYGKN